MAGAATAGVVEVCDETFDAVLGSEVPVLIDFSQHGCGPCLAMERQLDALAAEYAGRVRVATVEASRSPGVTGRYGVLGLPTFILFRGGDEVARLAGTPSKVALRRLLDDALAAPVTGPTPSPRGGVSAMERETVETPAVPYDPEVLEAMACDIGARPAGAPHFDDVAGALRAVRHEPGVLVVEYDSAAADILAGVVAAERVCCPEIGWHLERVAPPLGDTTGGVVRLRVEAGPAQLDVVGLLFEAASTPASGGSQEPPPVLGLDLPAMGRRRLRG